MPIRAHTESGRCDIRDAGHASLKHKAGAAGLDELWNGRLMIGCRHSAYWGLRMDKAERRPETATDHIDRLESPQWRRCGEPVLRTEATSIQWSLQHAMPLVDGLCV